MAWFSAGVLNNPAVNAILADTGAIPNAGSGRAIVVFSSDVAAIAIIEKRDAANTSNLNTQAIILAANETVSVELLGMVWAVNERFRVRLNAAVTGNVQASIMSA